MMPSCDQTGVPGVLGFTHFHSSTTSGSASLMSLRTLPRVSPRQSPSSAILFEMCSDADWPWFASDFFIVSSQEFKRDFICKTAEDNHQLCQRSRVTIWIRLPQVSFSMAMVEPVTLVGGVVKSAPSGF